MILGAGGECLRAAVRYWLPESGPFENYLELEEIVEAICLAEPSRLPPEDPEAQRGGRLA